MLRRFKDTGKIRVAKKMDGAKNHNNEYNINKCP